MIPTPPAPFVPLKAAGAAWRLVVSTNALCLLEAEVKDAAEIAKLMTGGDASFSTVRAAFWAALQDHHPEITLDDAGRLIDHLGLMKAGSLMGQALMLAFPELEAGADRPRKAAGSRVTNGIGGTSSTAGSGWISRLIPFGRRRPVA